MAKKDYAIRYASTNCHILEFNPNELRFDVTLGVLNKLEQLSKFTGEPKADEKVVAKMNAAFFDTSGKSGDIYSSFVDEGLYYHGSAEFYPTLVFWKDNHLSVEINPTQERHAFYQSNAWWAIGAAWTLILNGEVNYTYNKQSLIQAFGHPWTYQPRTLVGQKADGTIIWVTTDGRVSGSKGLTIDQEAALMKQLGCIFAVNMDGGGSSEQIVDGVIKNKLVGGYERPLGTAFMLYEKIEASTSIIPKITSVPMSAKGIVINTDNLNVRSGPSTSYSKIDMISKGTKIDIDGKSIDGSWYSISYNGHIGWVHNGYISITNDAIVMTTPDTKKTTANLNMRSARTVNSKVITTIPKGTTVPAYDESAGWDVVEYKGYTGYCCAAYLI